jgi:hypothetical protein
MSTAITDKVAPEEQHKFEDAIETMLFITMARIAAIRLLTEVQAYCRFDGARINQRLHEIWDALLQVPGSRNYTMKGIRN